MAPSAGAWKRRPRIRQAPIMKRKGFLSGLTLLLLACAATAPALTGTPSRTPLRAASPPLPADSLTALPPHLPVLAYAATLGIAGHPPVVSLAGLQPAHEGAVALIGMR